MNDIRVLLVEPELNDAHFVEEALAEMEERTHGGTWMHYRVSHLERASDAVIVLENEPPDIVLFNPTLPDSRGLETFTTFRDAALGVPLVALLDSGDEGLGRRMLREGAQDFILKSEVDCQPLARAILNSIERQRFQRATQRISAIDLETGFFNFDSFRSIASRELRLAGECGRAAVLLVAEIDSLAELDAACGRSALHETVVEAATVIRSVSRDRVVTGRIALGRFALFAWEESPERLLGAVQTEVQAGHYTFAFAFGYASANGGPDANIDALIHTAEAVLYENKQAYPDLP
jgi:PleD family two-component response regulator